MKHSLSRTTGLDIQGQGAQISPKKSLGGILCATGLQTHVLCLLCTQHPIMTLGLSYWPHPEQWHPILSRVMVKLASQLPLECSTILLGKLVLNCVIVVEPVEFMSHDLKLILYCVSGQTQPQELKKGSSSKGHWSPAVIRASITRSNNKAIALKEIHTFSSKFVCISVPLFVYHHKTHSKGTS